MTVLYRLGAVASVIALAACGGSGGSSSPSFDKVSKPSEVAPKTEIMPTNGRASYAGTMSVSFPKEEGFPASRLDGKVKMTADFDNKSLTGSASDFTTTLKGATASGGMAMTDGKINGADWTGNMTGVVKVNTDRGTMETRMASPLSGHFTGENATGLTGAGKAMGDGRSRYDVNITASRQH